MTPAQATRAATAYLDANIPNFLWGKPGIGKSDMVRAIAKQNMPWAARVFDAMGLPYPGQIPIIDLRAILLDPVDLRGLPAVVNGKAQWARPAFLPDEARDGPCGILFLDELNAAPPSTQAACYQLVLDRRIGEYVLPKGWRIIAAGNRRGDRASAQAMPTALANRFAHIAVDPDVKSWCDWAARSNIHPMVFAFIRWREELLHVMPGEKPAKGTCAAIPADSPAFPTPRAWEQVSKIADAPADLLQPLVAGIVSDGPAHEFCAFTRIYQQAPRIADIIANPDGAKLPDAGDMGTIYAVTSGLALKADCANFGPIVRYVSRLSPEFQAACVTMATRRDTTLTATPAYIEWTARNQGIQQ